MRLVTDEEINRYINEEKLLPYGFEPVLNLRGIHKKFEQEIIGNLRNTYKIIIRQSKFNPFDFSVIFGVMIGGEIFRLKRYNGNSHMHTNKLEKEKIKGFHIHTATERYQKAKWKQPENYAVSTKSYYDWNTALSICIKENNFIYPANHKYQTKVSKYGN